MQRKIRTRFAPSPTGNLHIGGARSALFAYLWAKKNAGDFLLRIEDTDQTREKEGSLAAILEGLRWLGIHWDEGPEIEGPHKPYFQSERLDLYQEYAEVLLQKGKAYRCFCTAQRLEELRTQQQNAKQAPRYDKRCRTLSTEEVEKNLQEKIPSVIRLAVPEQGSLPVQDLIRGEIVFDVRNVDDQVLMKSDGFPTYHLANVVDDHLMEITHVIRGEEWLPSTPKHVLLYQAFEWELPVFVHLSLFLSPEGGKMSKRHGETSLLAFRDQGYLPEAIVNGIALLGWNPKTEEEIFSLHELIERFDLSMIHVANPVFDTQKLLWMNWQYLRTLSTEALETHIQELAEHTGTPYKEAYQTFLQWWKTLSQPFQESIWKKMQERCKTLFEVAASTHSIQQPLPEYSPADLVWKKSTKDATIQVFDALLSFLNERSEEEFLSSTFEPLLLRWIAQNEWGNGDVLWPMRFALSGERQSPSPFELAEILGKNESIQRIEQAKQLLCTLP